MKDKLKTILKILASSVLIYIILSKVDRQEIIYNFSLIDWRIAPLILVLIIVHYFVSAYRWKSLLVHKGTEHVSIIYLVYLYFTGAFFNNFMPTSIGGDVYKVIRLSKKINDPAIAFSSTFTERFSGVLMLVLIASISLHEKIGLLVFPLLLALVVGFFVGIKILKWLSSKFSSIRKLYDAIIIYKDYPKVLIFVGLTSILVQILAIMTQYVVFLSIGIKLPIVYSFLAFPLITLAGFFIPSLNGIGVQEAMYMSMFSAVGVPAEAALSASIMYHVFRMAVSLIGGVLYALGKDA